MGVASASNSAEMQQQITMNIQARCDADAVQKIQDESYQIGEIKSDGNCSIATNNLNQKFACVNNIIAQATESATANQTATAKGGLDGMGLLMILLIIFAVLMGPSLIARMMKQTSGKGNVLQQI